MNMIDEKDLASCEFMPLSALNRVIDERHDNIQTEYKQHRHLWRLKKDKVYEMYHDRRNPYKMFIASLCRAIYSHNWDKLLYLLKKRTVYSYYPTGQCSYITCHLRAIMILLMYHPKARAHGFLNEFFEMAISCRTDEDKKLMIKCLVKLQHKMTANWLSLMAVK